MILTFLRTNWTKNIIPLRDFLLVTLVLVNCHQQRIIIQQTIKGITMSSSPMDYTLSRSVSLKRERPVSNHSSSHNIESKTRKGNLPTMRDLSCKSLLVSALNNKGVGFLEKREFAEAKDSLRKALRVVTSENHDDDAAIEEADAAALKHDSNDHMEGLVTADDNEASGPILSALSIPSGRSVHTSKNDDDSSTDSSSSKYLRHRSEYDEGMGFFSEPLLLNHDSPCVDAIILFNLGRVYHQQGKFEDALSLYRRSLCVLENSGASDPTTLLAILFNIGCIQYSSGDLADALKTYTVALDVSQSSFGAESIEVAAALNCIGVVHYIMPNGDSDRALEAVQISLNLRRSTGMCDSHLGTTLNNLGRIYFQRGDYEQAMSAYRESLHIRQCTVSDSVDVAAVIFNMYVNYCYLNALFPIPSTLFAQPLASPILFQWTSPSSHGRLRKCNVPIQ